MAKKILVTGAHGFIGTALCRFLSHQRAVTVLGIGRRKWPRLKILLKREQPDLIFHLAGGRLGELSQLISDNCLTTVHLLETIRSLRGYCPRVMIMGSAAEYGEVPGDGRRPILEKAANQPAGIYGWVKLLQTKAALHFAGLGQDIIIARLFNILGPGVGRDMVSGKSAGDIAVLERSSRSGTLEVSRLEVVRDFLDIRDVCEALYALSLKGKRGEIYNICSGQGATLRELLDGMIAASRVSGIKVKENKKINPGIIYSVGSNVKLRRTTGWRAKYSLPQSIRDTLAFWRQGHRSV